MPDFPGRANPRREGAHLLFDKIFTQRLLENWAERGAGTYSPITSAASMVLTDFTVEAY